MTSKISILLPVRDAASTLSRAIDSCLAQTFADFELIVIDDGSQDTSGDIAREYEKQDHRIRVIAAPTPGGLVAALQAGHAAAHGAFLARMDADDVSCPERLDTQMALLESRPEIAACGCGVRIVRRGPAGEPLPPDEGFSKYEAWINGLVEPDAIARERFVESPLVHPTVLLRRAALEAAGGYRNPAWAEDYDLWLRMLHAGMKLAKVPQILFEWTDGPARLTRTDSRYSEDNFLRAKAHYLALLAPVARRGVMISGAGPTGKRLAAPLRIEGVRVHAFLDPHPRRWDKRIGGVPVLPGDAIPEASDASPVQLGAVAQPGGRQRIEKMCLDRGYRAGVDYFAVA